MHGVVVVVAAVVVRVGVEGGAPALLLLPLLLVARVETQGRFARWHDGPGPLVHLGVRSRAGKRGW